MVGKIIIILSFRVGISKNKNTDHQIEEICAIMSTQVTYETSNISLLCDSPMSRATNFCLLCNLKEKDHVRRNINIVKKKEMFICGIIIILICKKLGLVRSDQQKIKLALP